MTDDLAVQPWAQFHAGQSWRYRAPAGFETSRILIGAVFCFAQREPVVACAVSDAPRVLPDGSLERALIPFLPITGSALAASVTELDGEGEVPDAFAVQFRDWTEDERGLTAFTVAFDGRLDHLIARQMAAIVGQTGD